ncbi:MAG TPA: hypothetical protein VGY58_14835, partial [Gemmataceae bacterium]|nr:hypothetical protein [Gemmataceae bacterium]
RRCFPCRSEAFQLGVGLSQLEKGPEAFRQRLDKKQRAASEANYFSKFLIFNQRRRICHGEGREARKSRYLCDFHDIFK